MMMKHLKTLLVASVAAIGLAGCYFTSEKNLIPPELRVDPFGESGLYIVPGDTPDEYSDEALARMPDGGFLSLKIAAAPEGLRYDFAAIPDAIWPDAPDHARPGAPYVMSICEIVPLDDVDSCALYAIFRTASGDLVTVTPGPAPDTEDDDPLVFDDLDAVMAALYQSWSDGHVESETMTPLIEVTIEELQDAGFSVPDLSFR